MNTVDRAYEIYLNRQENCIEINEKKYHRIVHKECYTLSHLGNVLSIILPMELFRNCNTKFVEDENGVIYELLGPEIIRFADGIIPEWYTNCFAFVIKGIGKVEQMGDYVKTVSEFSEC